MSRSGSACCVSRQDREVPKRRWGKDGSGSRRFRPGSARFRNHGAGREGRVGRVGRRLTRWEDLVLRLFLDDEPFELNNAPRFESRSPRSRGIESVKREEKAQSAGASSSSSSSPPAPVLLSVQTSLKKENSKPATHLQKIGLNKLPPQTDEPIISHTIHLHPQKLFLFLRQKP